MRTNRVAALLLVIFFAATLSFAQSPCDKLKSLSLPDTTLAAVEYKPAGPYSAPSPFAGAPAAKAQPAQTLPAYCRIALVLTPSKDSHIESEVWIPEDWNGKLQVVGNGGWAGTISFPAMAAALREGYATACFSRYRLRAGRCGDSPGRPPQYRQSPQDNVWPPPVPAGPR